MCGADVLVYSIESRLSVPIREDFTTESGISGSVTTLRERALKEYVKKLQSDLSRLVTRRSKSQDFGSGWGCSAAQKAEIRAAVAVALKPKKPTFDLP